MSSFSLYEAKTHLSKLVDRAAAGEEITISKNGVPLAKLVTISKAKEPRQPAGIMDVSYIAADFDAQESDITALFEGSD